MVYALKAHSDTFALAPTWDSEQQFCSLHSGLPLTHCPGLGRASLLQGKCGFGHWQECWSSQVVEQGAGSLGSWSPMLFFGIPVPDLDRVRHYFWTAYVRTERGLRARGVCTWQLQGL